MKVPVAQPLFDTAEEELLLETLRSGWIVQGKRVERFEGLFSQEVGGSFCVAVSNCTAALHLSLCALGIGPGDEVIVPSFTYVATANAVEHTGARTVFCDVDQDSFNLDPVSLQQKITPHTRAVIPVHLFGLAADMETIIPVCRQHGLIVVEDAACGLGTLFRGKHVGSFGAAGCFSFHPRKMITTAEGGMITVQEASLDSLLRSMRDHGASLSDFSRHLGHGSRLLPRFEVLGYNYRMTDLQAAIGIAQMEKLGAIIGRHRELAARYQERLRGIGALRIPSEPEGLTHTYQSFVIRCAAGPDSLRDPAALHEIRDRRDRIMLELESKGISTRQGSHAVHALGYYKRKYALRDESLMNSLLCDAGTIALPLYPQMTGEEQEYVIDSLLQVLGSS